jgi:hypothetical protein
MEMMNFHSPFPALFHMQLANAMRTSYLVSINIGVVKKGISTKASAKAPGLWVEKCVFQGIKSLVCGQC